jgi:O-antigen/teichoic acid export membrane protein
MVITSVLSSIAYPTISALKDGKKRATWRLIKISLILTIPISDVLIFYPAEILTLFGPSYALSSSTLQILSLTSLPTCISTGIGVLLYAYGNNRRFLFLGLVTSLPRVMLYFLFVSPLGENGAALSFLVGSISGAILAIIYSMKIQFDLHYKLVLILFLIPIAISIPLKFINLNPIVSIITILISSYVVFSLIKLIDSQDTEDIMKVLPRGLVKNINYVWRTMSKAKKQK